MIKTERTAVVMISDDFTEVNENTKNEMNVKELWMLEDFLNSVMLTGEKVLMMLTADSINRNLRWFLMTIMWNDAESIVCKTSTEERKKNDSFD